MRFGLVIYGDIETLSGGYLYDRKMVAHLRSQGDEVEIISIPWRNYAAHLGDNLSTALRRRLEHLEVDLLVQDELNHPSLLGINRWLQGRVHYPIIVIVHHLRSSEKRSVWMNLFYRMLERAYLAAVDGFIFNSHTTRRVVADLIGRVEPGVVAFPAGDRLNPQISEVEIIQRATLPGPLRLLFLGNVISRKGLHVLLEALTAMQGEAWSLTVAGSLDFDRRYARAVLGQVERNQLTDRVRFTGPLDEQGLAALLQEHHVLVVPSSYEGFGIAYLEGMGYGMPGIASTAGAAGEIITHGQNGFLIPPEDDRTLSLFLSQLGRDRDLLATMSLSARQRFLAHPTWEQTGAQIHAFLHNVLMI